jgi:hypothetical protein
MRANRREPWRFDVTETELETGRSGVQACERREKRENGACCRAIGSDRNGFARIGGAGIVRTPISCYDAQVYREALPGVFIFLESGQGA